MAISFLRDTTNGQVWLTENMMWKRYIGNSAELDYLRAYWEARGQDSSIYDTDSVVLDPIPRADV